MIVYHLHLMALQRTTGRQMLNHLIIKLGIIVLIFVIWEYCFILPLLKTTLIATVQVALQFLPVGRRFARQLLSKWVQ